MTALSLRRLRTAQQAMLDALPALPDCVHISYPNGKRCACDWKRRQFLLSSFLAVQDAGWTLQRPSS